MLHPPQETLDARALPAEVRGGNRPERAIPDAASAGPATPHLRVRGPEEDDVDITGLRPLDEPVVQLHLAWGQRALGSLGRPCPDWPWRLGLLRLDILVRREPDSAASDAEEHQQSSQHRNTGYSTPGSRQSPGAGTGNSVARFVIRHSRDRARSCGIPVTSLLRRIMPYPSSAGGSLTGQRRVRGAGPSQLALAVWGVTLRSRCEDGVPWSESVGRTLN